MAWLNFKMWQAAEEMACGTHKTVCKLYKRKPGDRLPFMRYWQRNPGSQGEAAAVPGMTQYF